MKQSLKMRISEYITSTTGPNRTRLFARATPGIIPVNLVLGGDFYSRFTP